MILYRNSQLHKNSKAYELYQQWQKTKDPKDEKILIEHMKSLEQVWNRYVK